MIIKAKLGKNPSAEEIMDVLVKLGTTVNVMDVPFIAANLMSECGVGVKLHLKCVWVILSYRTWT